MNRRNLLKGLGVIGLGSTLPFPEAARAVSKAATAMSEDELMQSAACWLSPQETEGPYYFNANLVRQDITQDTTTGTIH